MTPGEIISKIKRFATTNRKMLFSVVGGVVATGVIAGAIMYTSGTMLQGSVGTISESPTIIAPVTEETVETVALVNGTTSCAVIGETQSQSCTLLTTGAAGTQSRTCQRDLNWGDWSTCVAVAPPTCTSFTYSEWGTECLRGYNFRSILTSSPEGCEGGDPDLRRECVTADTCVAGTAPQTQSCAIATTGAAGTQTRTCNQDTLSGTWTWGTWGACAASAPAACTGYTYSTWSACVNNSQSRTVTSSTPSGCTGGATPVLTQSCSSGTPPPAGTGTPAGTPPPAGTGTPAGIEIQEEAPTACTGKDILSCSAMSDVLYLSDKIPLRLNCSLTANGIVSSRVIKGAISDPSKVQSEGSIMRILQEDKAYTASKTQPKGFHFLFDGRDKYDTFVDEGDYSILTTARVSANDAPDCSVQKFKVVKERPKAQGTGEQGTTGVQDSEGTQATSGTTTVPPAASGTSAETTAAPPAAPEAPPEPSKCPGIDYPKDIKTHWAEGIIRQSYDLCMFKGYDDGTFRPDRPVSRAEALKIILFAAKIPPVIGCYDEDCGSPFMDLEMWQGPWARAAWDLRIVKSAEKFRPNDALTRAEAALMVANAFISSGKIATPLRTDCYTPNCGAGHPDKFFTDITQMWQGPAIRWLWDAGLTQGRSPGRFEPDIPITRAELTKLVMTAASNT